MDSSVRVFHCRLQMIHPSRNHKQFRFHLPSSFPIPQIPLLHPHSHRLRLRLPPALVSYTQTREEGKKKTTKEKVIVHVRLDHQVEFGDHVVIRGSSKELGSWKKHVPLKWTPDGWVCDLELKGGDHIEFKFVIVTNDKSLLWETGENRVFNLPEEGHFRTVATWNATHENLELLPLDHAHAHARDEEHDNNNFGDTESDNGAAAPPPPPPIPLLEAEAEPSPFVGQWQGKAISFMRSNDHRSHEAERKWDTSGLEGLPLNLVQGDQNARNWWRKVLQFIIF